MTKLLTTTGTGGSPETMANKRLASPLDDMVAGFVVVRIKRSHHIMSHPGDPIRRTVVPVHAGQDIKRGLLRKIIDDAGMAVDEFIGLL